MTILRNTILNADWLKALPMLPNRSVNFILTDPPYITRYKSRDGRTVPNDDNNAWLKPAFAEMYRVLADLLPWIRTYASMISDLREGADEQEQAY